MKAHFSMFAGYNAWANERIYRAAKALSHADFTADQGAFFRSVCGTLNHLVVTDRIWLRRLTADGPVQTRLDEVLSEDIGELAALRRAEDERLSDFVARQDEATLAARFSYRTITGPADLTQTVASALAHLFNHQTHHRGQATVLLTRIGGREACPSLDLLLYQRESGVGLV